MKTFRSLLLRVLLLGVLVASAAGYGMRVSAQSPQPTLVPENDPTAALTAPPAAALQPAAFGGNAAVAPLAPAANYTLDDRYNTNVTGWAVYQHQTEAQVTAQINAGYRPIDITVETFSPSYLFTVVYVSNAGSYGKGFWWYYGVDEATLNADLATNNARLISIKAYDIGSGQIRFAVVMISNTGTDGTAWWWYYNQTVPDLSSLWSANHARITQIHAYVTGGQTRYVAVMVDDTGANARGFYWWVGQSVSSLLAHLNNSGSRLVDLDRNADGTYNAVLDPCGSSCPMWWWWVGVSTSNLISTVLQDGARIIDANPYPGCGGTCWDIVLVNNSNAITSRVGEALRSRTDGTVGLYLKQVGGPVLANLMDSTSFEPASTIKAAVHLYTMRSIQAGGSSLATQIPKYIPPVGSTCPGNTQRGTEDIQTADREMMWHSDNTRTRELVDHYGVANINSMLLSLGMPNTAINHIIGCGGPIPDVTTLDDLATLYQGVADLSFVDSTRRALFYSQMAGKAQFAVEGYDWTDLWSTDLPAIINAEAPAGMPQALKNGFRSKMELAYKAGNYKICTSNGCATYVDHISIFGHALVPFCDAGGPRQYVFGVFISNATSDANSSAAFTATKAELLREQIHAGLASCFHTYYMPGVRR